MQSSQQRRASQVRGHGCGNATCHDNKPRGAWHLYMQGGKYRQRHCLPGSSGDVRLPPPTHVGRCLCKQTNNFLWLTVVFPSPQHTPLYPGGPSTHQPSNTGLKVGSLVDVINAAGAKIGQASITKVGLPGNKYREIDVGADYAVIHLHLEYLLLGVSSITASALVREGTLAANGKASTRNARAKAGHLGQGCRHHQQEGHADGAVGERAAAA